MFPTNTGHVFYPSLIPAMESHTRSALPHVPQCSLEVVWFRQRRWSNAIQNLGPVSRQNTGRNFSLTVAQLLSHTSGKFRRARRCTSD